MSLASKMSKFLQFLYDSGSGITFPDESSIPLILTRFPAFIMTHAHLFIPKSIAKSFEKILTGFASLLASFAIYIKLQIINEEKVIVLPLSNLVFCIHY